MTAMKSTYPGLLILPDGTEIRVGDAVKIDKELSANAGVAEWIKSGWLVDEGAYRAHVQPADVKELEAVRDALAVENAAMAGEIADLKAQIDKATAPKK